MSLAPLKHCVDSLWPWECFFHKTPAISWYVLGELGRWCRTSLEKMLPQKGRAPAQPRHPPSTRTSNLILGQQLPPSQRQGMPEEEVGSVRGQVCTAENALPEEKPWRLPGHFTTNCYVLILY